MSSVRCISQSVCHDTVWQDFSSRGSWLTTVTYSNGKMEKSTPLVKDILILMRWGGYVCVALKISSGQLVSNMKEVRLSLVGVADTFKSWSSIRALNLPHQKLDDLVGDDMDLRITLSLDHLKLLTIWSSRNCNLLTQSRQNASAATRSLLPCGGHGWVPVVQLDLSDPNQGCLSPWWELTQNNRWMRESLWRSRTTVTALVTLCAPPTVVCVAEWLAMLLVSRMLFT